ncbi:competence type IV pilus minor pilin ComGD [Pseudalkalibacillus berkeleyi]|uniref:Prepilin-type N-terminal cleavage/methylation domain-containing protein n=1 Tax=Pseudalkalibacillus berkeleyi TaxID=1069813 RepID=A0ABS9H1V5_9BACL|nr:competence type IV pilus minor pilin ComGD [Pseudalkalibacillus berkeleyi]MCF6137886.1 prepilin-type N-terminal cleavage/methylation domain-containing protein [Pseudalkalibacillus berkeleyi]
MKQRRVLDGGYTLIEMMMVLFILVTMMGIVVVNVKPVQESRQIQQFIQLLTSDLHYAQQYALTERAQVQFKFNNASEQYTIQSGPLRKIKSVNYLEGVHFQEVSTGLVIEYNGNGTIKKGGTIILRTKRESYKFVFLLGKGRFYVEKL